MNAANGKPKKVRRRYSDDFRATALAMLAANGGNVERTAKALDIPIHTLGNWSKGQNPVPTELGQEKKREILDGTETLIWKLIGVELGDFKEMNIRDFGVAFGIAVDKYLALQGRPNVIAKNIDGRQAVVDPSKMTSEQMKHFGRWIQAMGNDQTVKYNPEPGDPDYDTGLRLLPDDGKNGDGH